MKTYCWNCRKNNEIMFPEWSLHNTHLIIGKCAKCGSQVYKRTDRKVTITEKGNQN